LGQYILHCFRDRNFTTIWKANFIIGSCGALEAPRLAALGKPYPGHVVALIDGVGQPVPDRDTGEIAVRRDDPVVMREYWNNAAAMREKFTGGWCCTGDMGCRDADGWIHFQGRSDDLIKTSGYRVGPAEVEASVMEVPGAAACAVIGVPDPERGEAIKAFVKVLPGHAPGDDLARRIQAHVKSRLAAHEYPREIEFLDDFPATVTGKIQRRELREAELRKRQEQSGDGR
jgi:acetyl-CoA synthetase